VLSLCFNALALTKLTLPSFDQQQQQLVHQQLLQQHQQVPLYPRGTVVSMITLFSAMGSNGYPQPQVNSVIQVSSHMAHTTQPPLLTAMLWQVLILAKPG
jgi:hypothetical protein